MSRDEDAKEIRVVTILVNETRVVAMVHDEVLEIDCLEIGEFVEHFENRRLDRVTVGICVVVRVVHGLSPILFVSICVSCVPNLPNLVA